MAKTSLASCVGRVSASADVRLLSLLLLVVSATLIAPTLTARAATLDQDLRFIPSSSGAVTGYLVYVGSAPGFFAGGGDYSVDIGRTFQLSDGVGLYPLAGVIDRSAYLVMQAYDALGAKSAPSNELYVQITPPVDPNACATNADCADGDACNGAEQCVSGACVSGTALTCFDPGPCQVGWCDATSGCRSDPAPDGGICSDGNSVTLADACYAGVCVGVVPAPVPDPTPVPDPDPTPDPTPSPSPPLEGSPGTLTAVMFEDFENARAGGPPAPFVLTDESGARLSWSWMFAVIGSGDNGLSLAHPWQVVEPYFVHYDAPGSASWQSYEYAGRIRIDDPAAHVGVTIVSRQPDGGGYVALVRDAEAPSFALEVTPASAKLSCVTDPDTRFVPEPGAWATFRLRSSAEVDGVRVQAKAWDRRDPEPSDWSVDCFVAGSENGIGRVGLLASGPGGKYFDDLAVWPVQAVDGSGSDPGTPLPLHQEDFEDHVVGQHPVGWLDGMGATAQSGSDPLSWIEQAPGSSRALTMRGLGSEVSSQIDESGSAQWQDYEVTGRMMAESSRGRFGLLVYNQRLTGGASIGLLRGRRSDTFRVSVLGGSQSSCSGRSDTLVRPSVGEWQQFRLRAMNEGTAVHVQARIWRDGAAEPTTWEADCTTAPGAVSGSGTFGVWSYGSSAKYWDDIVIREVEVE